ncbi:hypothetical protein DDD_2495 [Nonlabens dokdonensis DSW-6]|uniref:Uncharacterized protein n=1 Tax=Nonlabens dokdonensis (strain DSM 17205 / KCTC 12402 / DSW-6) TaxID=592029 RepID=L7WFE5_NONDD|nr:hypothetical protein DDD_2495 [Nonlabens dokdonensis DSW-6]
MVPFCDIILFCSIYSFKCSAFAKAYFSITNQPFQASYQFHYRDKLAAICSFKTTIDGLRSTDIQMQL